MWQTGLSRQRKDRWSWVSLPPWLSQPVAMPSMPDCSHLPLWAWGDRRYPNQGSEEQAYNDNSQNSKMGGGIFSLLGQRVPHAWGLRHTAHHPPC